MSLPNQTAANVRGDIQQGLSGDKQPGVDPAAAPMETDAEAGGTARDAEQVQIARQTQRNPDPSDWQGTDATAMRKFEPELASRRSPLVWVGAIAVLAVFAIFLIAFGSMGFE
jgi:hypothetical protein